MEVIIQRRGDLGLPTLKREQIDAEDGNAEAAAEDLHDDAELLQFEADFVGKYFVDGRKCYKVDRINWDPTYECWCVEAIRVTVEGKRRRGEASYGLSNGDDVQEMNDMIAAFEPHQAAERAKKKKEEEKKKQKEKRKKERAAEEEKAAAAAASRRGSSRSGSRSRSRKRCRHTRFG